MEIDDIVPLTTEVMAAAGRVVLEDVLNAINAFPPKAPGAVPLRSGEIAPINT